MKLHLNKFKPEGHWGADRRMTYFVVAINYWRIGICGIANCYETLWGKSLEENFIWFRCVDDIEIRIRSVPVNLKFSKGGRWQTVVRSALLAVIPVIRSTIYRCGGENNEDPKRPYGFRNFHLGWLKLNKLSLFCSDEDDSATSYWSHSSYKVTVWSTVWPTSQSILVIPPVERNSCRWIQLNRQKSMTAGMRKKWGSCSNNIKS